MKRVLSLILCMVSLLVLAVPAFAAERTEGNVVYRDEFTLEDGFTVVREIVDVSFARSAEKTFAQNWKIKNGSTVVANIEITATYYCDGRSVYVVSKTVSRADTPVTRSSPPTGVTADGHSPPRWGFSSATISTTSMC